MAYSGKSNTGFTMLEILVTVIIMGIFASISMFSIRSWLPDMRLKSASSKLYSNIVDTRMKAVSQSKTWAIIFNTAANQYFICDDWGSDGTWLGTGDSIGTGDNNIVKTYCMDGSLFNAAPATPCASRKSGIVLGHGNAMFLVDGTTPVSPGSTVTYTNNLLTFNHQGLSTAGYIYLQNKEAETSFAVGTQSTGVVRSWKSGKSEVTYVR